MRLSDEEYRNKHLKFWSLENVTSPLLGFTIGAGIDSWSYWQNNSAAKILFSKSKIYPGDLNPSDFVTDQIEYLKNSELIEDDIYRTAMPFASIPWMEAILGCPILSSGISFKSEKIITDPDNYERSGFSIENKWVEKYIEFIKIYNSNLKDSFPVGQSILRGPSDLACAILGVEGAAIALLTQPDSFNNLLIHVTNILEEFLRYQLKYLHKFKDGYVIGQYEIWAPEPVIRIQEDFSTLYSPELYNQFLKPLDEKLCGISNYSLIHLHSSSLFLIEQFLDIKSIRAFQVTKDPGGLTISEMISSLQKIQERGHPLIVKGQFNNNEISLMKEKLTTRGLCIQPVVSSHKESETMLQALENWG